MDTKNDWQLLSATLEEADPAAWEILQKVRLGRHTLDLPFSDLPVGEEAAKAFYKPHSF